MKRILACIDASSYTNSICDLTGWAAMRLGAGVDLLHVIQRRNNAAARHDLNGAIGLGVKGALLEELTRLDEAGGRVAVERGRLLLAAAAKRLNEAGAPPRVRSNLRLIHTLPALLRCLRRDG